MCEKMDTTEPELSTDGGDDVQKTAESMHFTNLIDDCKEKIFTKLKLTDLLNIADASPLFYRSACLVFERNYSKKRIIIDQKTSNRKSMANPTDVLKLIRNFGHLISDMHINFALFSKELCDEIEHYLMTYCHESLIFLSLRCNQSKVLFQRVEKPFAHIYSIEMEGCCFFKCEPRWFDECPTLRYLQVGSNRYENRSHINISCPFMKSIAILKEVDENDIEHMLRLNPQLEKLLLSSNYSSLLIRRINENLPKLQCLCLRDLPSEFMDPDFIPIHFDKLTDFSMSTVSTETLSKLPFTFRNLRHFTMVGSMNLNQQWLNFFGSFDNMKTIDLFDVSGDIRLLFKLQNVRLSVERINITMKEVISSEYVVKPLKQNRCFKKLTVISSTPDLADITKEIQSSLLRESGFWDVNLLPHHSQRSNVRTMIIENRRTH